MPSALQLRLGCSSGPGLQQRVRAPCRCGVGGAATATPLLCPCRMRGGSRPSPSSRYCWASRCARASSAKQQEASRACQQQAGRHGACSSARCWPCRPAPTAAPLPAAVSGAAGHAQRQQPGAVRRVHVLHQPVGRVPQDRAQAGGAVPAASVMRDGPQQGCWQRQACSARRARLRRSAKVAGGCRCWRQVLAPARRGARGGNVLAVWLRAPVRRACGGCAHGACVSLAAAGRSWHRHGRLGCGCVSKTRPALCDV